eukprot:jgi/Ulvmu1/2283/UM013_0130.1
MAKACENWASALLLHLLSDSSGSQTSPQGQFDSEVNKKTAALAQHLLQLQCTPAHSRPALAASLRPAIIASLDELAQIEAPSTQDGAFHGGPSRATNPMTRESGQVGYEVASSEAETDSSSDELRSPASLNRANAVEDDVASLHGLRLDESFPVEAMCTNKWTNDYFLLNEPSAARAIFEASTESDVLLPSYVVFDGTSGPISTLRLASFTGSRFFRSIFSQLEAAPPRSASHANPSSSRAPSSRRRAARSATAARACFRVSDWGNKMRLDAVSADTLDVLLRLMEGRAPPRVTLRQACELFGALDYCLAQNLAAVVVYYLGPLIMALSPKEVAWLLARSVPHVPEPEMADRALEIIKSYGVGATAAMRPPPPSSPAAAAAAHAEPESCGNEASCVHAAIFAGRELARCGRGKPYTRALLKICWQEGAPRWLRVSALAAACATAGGGCDGACDGVWGHRQMLKEMTDATDVLLAAYPREVGTMRSVFQQACMHAAADSGGHVAVQALAAVLHRIAVFAPRAAKPLQPPTSTGGPVSGGVGGGGSVAGSVVGRLQRPASLSWAGHLRRHARADAGSGLH